jgi:hypothetical protein
LNVPEYEKDANSALGTGLGWGLQLFSNAKVSYNKLVNLQPSDAGAPNRQSPYSECSDGQRTNCHGAQGKSAEGSGPNCNGSQGAGLRRAVLRKTQLAEIAIRRTSPH